MFTDSASFVEYWKNARSRTLRILDRLRSEDLEWSYAPGKFTFGDLFRHLAGIERYMYAENVLNRLSIYPGHSPDLAAGSQLVRAYLERTHAEAVAIFSGLTTEALTSKCVTPAGTPITVWKWLRSMVEHEAHHRGQLYLMAGMRGLQVPPLFGLTEEQVRSLSSPSKPNDPVA